MLKCSEIEKLEIAKKLLEEVVGSSEFSELDLHPDLNLYDSLQGIQEVLDNHYPCGYEPPKPVKHLYRVRPWHEKLKDHIFASMGEIAVTSLIVAALSGCAWLTFWGLSDIDKGLGNRFKPDFAAQSQMYRGLAIASLGISLGCSVVAGCVIGGKKDA